MVNGLEKNTNDITIETAFRQVVTVAAARAPLVLTSVRTIWIPKYPVRAKSRHTPYVNFGYCKMKYNRFVKIGNTMLQV